MGESAPVINPVKELRKKLGLTQAQLAEIVGRSRATVADVEQMRRATPPMLLFRHMKKLGFPLDLHQAAIQYRAARAGLGPEWLNSGEEATPATSGLAPSHPLQQFLALNGLEVEDLRNRLGRHRCVVIDKILNRAAPLKVAADFFRSLKLALPFEWSKACLSDNAIEMYRTVLAYYSERDGNGWQTWLSASQPREVGE